MIDLAEYSLTSACDLAQKVKDGHVCPERVVQLALQAAEKAEELNAFVEVNAESALNQAQRTQQRMKDGEELALGGVPVAVKANICVKGMLCDCASRVLEGYRAPYDSTVVRLLKDAGAVIIGTTNMDEFAMGSSSGYSSHGSVFNPFDTSLSPGGSSGGSAAAVSSGVVPVALGSDTGGSVRQPASMCGLYGLLLPYGSVSRNGLVAFASSLDQIGFLSRSTDDLHLIARIAAQPDAADHSMLDEADQLKLERPERSLLVPQAALSDAVDMRVRRVFERFVDKLRTDGWNITVADGPDMREALSAYYIVAMSEAFSNLARFDGLRFGRAGQGATYRETIDAVRTEGFGEEVKRRLVCGAYALSEGYYDKLYSKAVEARVNLREHLVQLEVRHGPILTPSSPLGAFEHSDLSEEPCRMYECDLFTVLANLCCAGSASIPAGLSDGCPVGAMFTSCGDKEDSLAMCRELSRYSELHTPQSHV